MNTRILRCILMILGACFLAPGILSSSTYAAPALAFTVNSVADTDDGACNAASCTLREALNAANATALPASINFNIPGAGVKTIRPTTPLPAITTDELTIDGYMQPGASPNTLKVGDNAVLLIELDGHLAPAGTFGLMINADQTAVRGLVINRFSDSGLFVSGSFNVIAGNFIGTNAAGTAARANGDGIVLCGDGVKNFIGDAATAARNLISGNTSTGINMARCSVVPGGNAVQGNYIGTNRNGNSALRNPIGVLLRGMAHVVGGVNAAARNVISGNGDGVVFDEATDTIVSANYIGTQADGKHALPNDRGILFYNLSQTNRIGGTTKAEANRIAFNRGSGVSIGDSATATDVNNTIQGNSIYSNGSGGGLGIDLGMNGVTANDANDSDLGPNLLQNFPVLTRVASATKLIKGRLNSVPNLTFTLEFFSTPACDPSGMGQGKTFLGRTNVTTDGFGNVNFSFTSPKRFAVGNAITVTATDPSGNTSEFSHCKTAR